MKRPTRAINRRYRRRKCGQSQFTRGIGKDLVAEGDARTHYLAALRALDANENDMKLLLAFARS
jgi:hypothetical protein